MDTRDDRRTNCAVHGRELPAILCRHLVASKGASQDCIGWVQAEWNPESREPGDLMAWCAECHEHYELEGDWTDTTEPFAAFRVVCEMCFWEVRDEQQSRAV